MFMNMQGNRQAIRGFYKLLSKLLATIDIYPLFVDGAIFTMKKNDSIIIILVQTDDLLSVTNNHSLKDEVLNTLLSAFKVTTQGGIILKYLNFWIIQSLHGISIDQCDHILDLVNSHIPVDMKIRTTNTRLWSDRQFNNEVASSLSCSPAELKQLEKKFGFEFCSLYDALLHISSSSCPDLANAMNRVGIFQAGPNRLGFESLHRCLRYLGTHPNVLFMHSRKPFIAESWFQSHYSKSN